MKVVWTDQAFRRLVAIENHIAADDPAAAVRWVERLIDRAEELTDFPEMGRRLPELPGTSLRELVVGNYRIVYRIRRELVEVITVFEAHRLLPEDDLPGSP